MLKIITPPTTIIPGKVTPAIAKPAVTNDAVSIDNIYAPIPIAVSIPISIHISLSLKSNQFSYKLNNKFVANVKAPTPATLPITEMILTLALPVISSLNVALDNFQKLVELIANRL